MFPLDSLRQSEGGSKARSEVLKQLLRSTALYCDEMAGMCLTAAKHSIAYEVKGFMFFTRFVASDHQSIRPPFVDHLEALGRLTSESVVGVLLYYYALAVLCFCVFFWDVVVVVERSRHSANQCTLQLYHRCIPAASVRWGCQEMWNLRVDFHAKGRKRNVTFERRQNVDSHLFRSVFSFFDYDRRARAAQLIIGSSKLSYTYATALLLDSL